MIRKNQAFLNRVNIILDMILAVLSFTLAPRIKRGFFDGQGGNTVPAIRETLLPALVYSFVLFFLLSVSGFYNTTRTRRLAWKSMTIFICVTISALAAAAMFLVFRPAGFSGGAVPVFYLLTVLLLTAKYAFMRLTLNIFRGKGYNLKHVLVIGTGRLARQYREDIEAEPELGFRIKGFVGDRNGLRDGEKWLCGFPDLDRQLAAADVSEAIIALDPEEYGLLLQIIPACERNGVKYSVIPFYNDIIPDHPVIETIGRSKLIGMRVNRLENLGWAFLKRGFDIAVSITGIIILSPLFLIIATGVRFSGPGPVLFRQTRVGYLRREFRMLKFRSMKQNDEEDTGWSADRDDRRTPFGAFIRKFSLDELPQLFNVLSGQMSLVGPRPELPHFVEQFRKTIPYYMVKHQIKPGMTGWAQVNGCRGDTSIEKRAELDLWYIEHWSPWLDIRIIFRTVFGGIVNTEKMK